MKYALCIFSALIIFPFRAFAASAPLIGAIQPSGAAADDEFIEITNSGDEPAGLESWSVQYKSANGQTYYKKNFPKGASVGASGKYVVCGAGYSGACDMKQSTISLSSAGGTVFLVKSQTLISSASDENIVAQKTYVAEEPGAKPLPPQNEIPPLPSPTSSAPAKIIMNINELMPDPAGGNEWVEIFNPNGYAADLENWTLSDGTGKKFLALSGLIMPNGYRLLELPSDKLNDDGDLLILREANGQEIDSIAYGDWNGGDPSNATSAPKGAALARIGDGRDTGMDNSDFAMTAAPTPGASNVIKKPNDTGHAANGSSAAVAKSSSKNAAESTDLAWLKELLNAKSDLLSQLLRADNVVIVNNLYLGSSDAGKITAATASVKAPAAKSASAEKLPAAKSQATVTGTVLLPAGVMGSDVAVISDGKTTTEIRVPKDLKTPLAPGDVVRASGTWSTAKGLPFPKLLVKSASACTVADHEDLPEPPEISLAEASKHVGALVTASGTVTSRQKSAFKIAAGEDAITIKSPFECKPGDLIEATGLMAKSASEYVLIPSAPDAVRITPPAESADPSFARRLLPYGIAAAPAGLLVLAVKFGKRLRKKGGEANA